jgi:DNA-binding transcriptional LysR family regulator
MPDKWISRWRERERRSIVVHPVTESEQLTVVLTGTVDVCFVRSQSRTEECHVIPLYVEQQVVVVPLDHVVTAFDTVDLADLDDEQLLQAPARIPGWAEVTTANRLDWPTMTDAEAIELAATGAGIVIVPQSVARLHHRKDVTFRPVADLTPTPIGLAWLKLANDPGIDTFIGIVRGRTERSSRS